MDTAQMLGVLVQFGLGLAAWRLANALKFRVDDHEVRVKDHERRIVILELREPPRILAV